MKRLIVIAILAFALAWLWCWGAMRMAESVARQQMISLEQ